MLSAFQRPLWLTEEKKNAFVDTILKFEHLGLSISYRAADSMWGKVCTAMYMLNNIRNRKLVYRIWTSNSYKIQDFADRKQLFQKPLLSGSQSYNESNGEIYIRSTKKGIVVIISGGQKNGIQFA